MINNIHFSSNANQSSGFLYIFYFVNLYIYSTNKNLNIFSVLKKYTNVQIFIMHEIINMKSKYKILISKSMAGNFTFYFS